MKAWAKRKSWACRDDLNRCICARVVALDDASSRPDYLDTLTWRERRKGEVIVLRGLDCCLGVRFLPVEDMGRHIHMSHRTFVYTWVKSVAGQLFPSANCRLNLGAPLVAARSLAAYAILMTIK
jgi:hypothetical protein